MWLFITITNLTFSNIKERNNESDTICVHLEQLVSLKLEAEKQVSFKICSWTRGDTFVWFANHICAS